MILQEKVLTITVFEVFLCDVKLEGGVAWLLVVEFQLSPPSLPL